MINLPRNFSPMPTAIYKNIGQSALLKSICVSFAQRRVHVNFVATTSKSKVVRANDDMLCGLVRPPQYQLKAMRSNTPIALENSLPVERTMAGVVTPAPIWKKQSLAMWLLLAAIALVVLEG